MISRLSGVIGEKRERTVTVDVQGVGYRVFVSSALLHDCQLDDPITLFIHTNVREDALELFGFIHRDERNLFEQLIGVSGVGPKTALAVLSIAKPEEIRYAIHQGDATLLMKVSGIGRKTAERIVVELKEKVAPGTMGEGGGGADGEALDALVGLGYNTREARDALRSVKGTSTDAGSRIKEALKMLSR